MLSVFLPLLLLCCSSARGSLLELSYTYLQDAPTSPKLKAFELLPVKKGRNKFGIWVELNNFCSSEHSGTHLDAPAHFSIDGWSVDQVPLSRLYRRPGVMVDVSSSASKFETFNNYEVEVRDLERWEAAHGTIPDGAVVILHTGWGRRSNNITAYSGLDQHDKLNFPGISIELARWLASYGHNHDQATGIVGVGIDTISLDVGSSVLYETHVLLLGHNIYGLENLANTDKLPATGFIVTSLPLRVLGGSGSPVRVVAELGIDAATGVGVACATAPSGVIIAAATGLVVAVALLKRS